MVYTGCPKKKYTLFWGALAPTFFELCLKVGGVSESPRVDASFAYNSFSVALNTPEIFEFKVGRLQKKCNLLHVCMCLSVDIFVRLG